MRVVGYVRVSTVQQADGLSLEGQTAKLEAECAHRGWELVRVRSDTATGKNTKRPGLGWVLTELGAHKYDALMVTRLDRLSRSTGDFAVLLDRAKREGWQIICLDPMVDMTTPYGEAMAGMAAVFAQLEHRLISQRQIESVAARKAAGTWAPAGQAASKLTPADEVRIVRMRAAGATLRAIAAEIGTSKDSIARALARNAREAA